MTTATTPLRGIVTALVTPLHPDGRIDTEGLKALVDVQIGSGVHAVFPLGTTGEVSYLTTAQRVDVVGTVIEHVAGRVPVVAGVVEMSAARAIDEVRALAELRPDYLVATPPVYGDGTDGEVVAHFERIAASADAPLIAYDIPFKTHRKLTAGIVRQLVKDQTIVAVKDSSGDFRTFRGLVTELADSPVALLTGTEQMVDVSVMMGASGAVLGLANVDPRGFVEVYDAAVAGDWERARTAQERLVRLVQIMDVGVGFGLSFDSSIFGALKHVLASDGIIASAQISSGTPLPAEAAARIDEIVQRSRQS